MHSFTPYDATTTLHTLKRAKSVKDAFPPTPQRIFSSSSLSGRSPTRRRLHRLTSTSSEIASCTPVTTLSDLEFNFSTSFGDSDAESLPDLTDDASIAGSVCSAITPTKNTCLYFEDAAVGSKNLLTDLTNCLDEEVSDEFSFKNKEVFDSPFSTCLSEKPQSLFEIPELVHEIIMHVDAQNPTISDPTPLRRKPLSYNHALLMHGTPEAALQAMQNVTNSSRVHSTSPNAMHSCLLVNKLFHRITKDIMSSKVCFSTEKSFYQFVRNESPEFYGSFRPTSLILNKLFCAKQTAMDKISRVIDYSRLELLEVNMCPKLLPSESLLHSSLRTLIVTGSKIMNDSLLINVAKRCPNLHAIDLRACESITDYGVYAIATSCTRIYSINLGRKKRGHLITDHSVSTLVYNNKRLETVGLAGCYITDRTIWELAMNCGFSLERLSLNNCPYVTNQSLPVILQHNLLPNLSVLEIRFVKKITNFDPIVTFRRKQNSKGICMLIETCEELLIRLKECELRMDNHVSESIFRDISDWANSKDDEDVSYQTLMSGRISGSRHS